MYTCRVKQVNGKPCAKEIPPSKLMCGPDWKRVSYVTQQQVYKTYREWKAGGSTAAYIIARDRAIAEAEQSRRDQA